MKLKKNQYIKSNNPSSKGERRDSSHWHSTTGRHSCGGRSPIIMQLVATIISLLSHFPFRLKLSTFHLSLITYFLVIAVSCNSPAYLSEQELLEYIRDQDNGLVKTKQAPPFNLTVQYRPNDLLVLQELGKDRDVMQIAKARVKYRDYAYFILSMDIEGKNALYGSSADMAMFSENLQNLSFRMADKVSLITSAQDTIEVADYIFDRTYGMGSTTLMFVFSKDKLKDAEWFTFNLKEFGMGTGDQRFRFKNNALFTTPRLKELTQKDQS